MPDISYATQQLSQFMQSPCNSHFQAALHLLKYIKGTIYYGLLYSNQQKFSLQGYCDADWACCKVTRKSITGYCILFGDSLISWKTKKQSTVSHSTAELEYRSMSQTTCELQWISCLLADFHINYPLPISLYCGNQAAIAIAKNPVFHKRTKHVEADCQVVRNCIDSGFLQVNSVTSRRQLANLFTKPISTSQMAPTLLQMGFTQALHKATKVLYEGVGFAEGYNS